MWEEEEEEEVCGGTLPSAQFPVGFFLSFLDGVYPVGST